MEEFIRENQDKLVAIGEVGKKCHVPYQRKLTLHEINATCKNLR